MTRKKFGILTKSRKAMPWTEDLIRSVSEGLALAADRVDQEEFVRHCIAAVPNRAAQQGKRDTRRQDIIRGLRRLAELDALPFKVVDDHFVFEGARP